MILSSSLLFIQCTSDVIQGPEGIAGIDGVDGVDGVDVPVVVIGVVTSSDAANVKLNNITRARHVPDKPPVPFAHH